MSRYDKRGVSADKSEVHSAIKNLDKGLFPNAFCKILPDITGGDSEYVNIMHADTAGTKTSLYYLYWKETGNTDLWKGVSQDAIVMNVDDMACAGAINDIIISSTIGRNKHLIPGEVLKEVIQANEAFCQNMRDHGVSITLAGGETADVGDIVRTLDVGITAFARIPKTSVIDCDIQAGQVVVGLSSSGQATYEKEYNSGIGSNGLTSARHDALSSYHKLKYPETFDPNTPDDVVYIGQNKITDSYKDHIVGDLLTSPTRTYLPVMKELLDNHKDSVKGIIHCTGGAQTKVLKFCTGVHIIKDNLFVPPPVFEMIQTQTNADYKEMFKVFNMGHRLEIYTDHKTAQHIIALSNSFNIDAQIIGHVESATSSSPELTIKYDGMSYHYYT